jgi:Fe-S cluster assembly ATP-binding protein
MGALIITHHERLLEFNQPDFTHVMLAGRVVESAQGGALAHDVHANGYAAIRERHPVEAAEEQAAREAREKEKEPLVVTK